MQIYIRIHNKQRKIEVPVSTRNGQKCRLPHISVEDMAHVINSSFNNVIKVTSVAETVYNAIWKNCPGINKEVVLLLNTFIKHKTKISVGHFRKVIYQ